MIENFSKLDHDVQKVLFGEGKINQTVEIELNGREGQKMSKILTAESISEPTRFDQSVSLTCKIKIRRFVFKISYFFQRYAIFALYLPYSWAMTHESIWDMTPYEIKFANF